jgi:hypothetical protein
MGMLALALRALVITLAAASLFGGMTVHLTRRIGAKILFYFSHIQSSRP